MRQVRRLLVLAPSPPHLDGRSGGTRVIGQMISALAERHQVGLLCFRRVDESPLQDELRERLAFAEEVLRSGPSFPPATLARPRRWLATVFGDPGWVRGRASRVFAARLQEVVAAFQPDVIQAEYHVMGQYFAGLRGGRARRVLTQHEPGITAAADRHASARGIRRVRTRLELRSWRRYELRVMRDAQAVVVFTQRDFEVVTPLAAPNPVVRIPFGTVPPPRPLNPLGRGSSILFVGNYQHRPNVNAAKRLVRSILPHVKAVHPNVMVRLVGGSPPAEIISLCSNNVEVPGFVPDLETYLDEAAVVVAPIHSGGGMRVKVLEALAAGKAMVATPLAVEGLNVSTNEQLLIAESDEDFAAAIVLLMEEPERRAALAQRARDWALNNLCWEESVTALEGLYDSLLGEHSYPIFEPSGQIPYHRETLRTF
jgi:polysaccharide biosynthesis protein PslH